MLAKLACCSYDLMQVPPSLLAAGVLTLALKLAATAAPERYEGFKLKKVIKSLGKQNGILPSRVLE